MINHVLGIVDDTVYCHDHTGYCHDNTRLRLFLLKKVNRCTFLYTTYVHHLPVSSRRNSNKGSTVQVMWLWMNIQIANAADSNSSSYDHGQVLKDRAMWMASYSYQMDAKKRRILCCKNPRKKKSVATTYSDNSRVDMNHSCVGVNSCCQMHLLPEDKEVIWYCDPPKILSFNGTLILSNN